MCLRLFTFHRSSYKAQSSLLLVQMQRQGECLHMCEVAFAAEPVTCREGRGAAAANRLRKRVPHLNHFG